MQKELHQGFFYTFNVMDVNFFPKACNNNATCVDVRALHRCLKALHKTTALLSSAYM